jgi:hypothetical protein
MAAKTSRAAKEPTAKRPSKKQTKEEAELAARKVHEVRYFQSSPGITPLELAHLAAAMGLGDRDDAPAKAFALFSRSLSYLARLQSAFDTMNTNQANYLENCARVEAAMGLTKEDRKKKFSIEQVIAKMPKELLSVAGRQIRGKELWEEFRRQVDPKSELLRNTEEYSIHDLISVFEKFNQWRDKLAAENKTKGRKNIDKVNQKRRKDAPADYAEAVDAVPLPKSAP